MGPKIAEFYEKLKKDGPNLMKRVTYKAPPAPNLSVVKIEIMVNLKFIFSW